MNVIFFTCNPEHCYLATVQFKILRGPFEKSVVWRKSAAVMQRETVTVMPSYSGGGKVVAM
jgi:hypothetical protein